MRHRMRRTFSIQNISRRASNAGKAARPGVSYCAVGSLHKICCLCHGPRYAPHTPTNPIKESMKYKILIADDEPGLRTILALQLSEQGHEITSASSGDEVIQLIPQIKPDLVVTDIKMSPGDGFE